MDCFRATLSKGLGLGIIAGSVLVKVPQILKIYRSKSGEGISIVSVTFDLTAITIYMSYSFMKGFPFTAWGDSSFLALQTLAVGVLVLFYAGLTIKAVGYLLVYFGVVLVLCGGFTPVKVLWTMQGFNIPILLVGKLSQAYANYTNGHTGQLSAVTLFMLFFGSLARIFTSIQETGDTMVILTYIVSTSANALIVAQLLYYWNVGVAKKKVE